MPPTEQIFWEAKHKPGSLKGSRRTSTVVDSSGCKVTRGFLLPSRSSSRDSSVSSHGIEAPGTPASPLEEAAPGFGRPTGSLYHAPEMATLRSHSDSSLHKPTNMGVFQRLPQLGGRSQTFHGRRARSWQDACYDSTLHPDSALDLNSSDHLVRLRKSMRRTKSDHTGLISMQAAEALTSGIDIPLRSQGDAEQTCAIVGSVEEENAIASDSEDDGEGDLPLNLKYRQASGIAAQRSRPTYAQRRAMSDQRVTNQRSRPPLLPTPPILQVTNLVVSTTTNFMSAGHEADRETPIEVKSFSYEEVLPPTALRPSRSRPRPLKGVLKKGGSRSSSEDSTKRIHVAIGGGSRSVLNGGGVPESTSQVE